MVKKEVQDRRKFPRLFAYHLAKYNLSAPIKSDKLIMASISDISAGGARLRLSQNLPVSSLIQLFINFPQLPQPLISIAKVVWSRKLKKAGIYESGLQFVDIEDSGKQKISARVEAIKKLILAVLVLFLAKTTFCFAEVIPPAMAARQGVVYAALRDVEMSRTLQQEESLQKAESSALEKRSPGIWNTIATSTHPFVDYTIAYNDNVYQVSQKPNYDMISTLTPSIKFMLGPGKPPNFTTKKPHLLVDVGVDLIRYAVTEHKRNNPYANVSAQIGEGDQKLLIDYSFKENTGVSSTISTTSPPGLMDYKSFDSDITYEATFNHLGFDLGYTRNVRDYEGSQFKSGNTYLDEYVSLTGYVIPMEMPKTRFLMEFDYGRHNYYKSGTNANNSWYGKVWVGAKERITKKVSGLIKFGYQKRDYEVINDKDSFVTNINLEYKQSPVNSYLLDVVTGGKDSDYRDQQYSNGFTVKLDFRHYFGADRKLRFNFGPNFDRNNYLSGAKDRTFGITTGLRCDFRKWFNMYLQYSFAAKDSSTGGGGYNNNIGSLKTEIIF